MRRNLIVICLAAVLTAAANAADSARKAEIAETKAAALEKASANPGGKATAIFSPTLTKTDAQVVDPVGEEPLDDAITCLSRTIYWEAKNEGIAGMEAVASVVMNRLRHEGFPNKICEVVRQGREVRGACQFSWWCDGHSDDAEEKQNYTVAKEVAIRALNRQLRDRTGGAMYFHRKDVAPAWAREYKRTAQIGDHIFYKPYDGDAK